MIYKVLLKSVSRPSCKLDGINFKRKVKEFDVFVQNRSIRLHPQQKERLKIEVDSVHSSPISCFLKIQHIPLSYQSKNGHLNNT